MKKFFVPLLIMLTTMPAWSQDVKNFQWLVGTWKMVSNNPDKHVYEVWKDASPEMLSGISFKLQQTDTVVTEEIKLHRKGDGFCYTPDVAGPQEAVDFKITYQNTGEFIAENPGHDFPKKIHYRRVTTQGEEQLQATIEGDGKSIYFTFVRVK